MEIRQNTNDFAKGMTNIPSDNICPDDSVAAEWNMIFRNGEHCPIQAPVNPFENQDETDRKYMQLIYIHNYNDVKRCIFYDENSQYIYWARYDNIETTVELIKSFKINREEITGITSIGNTLIISLSTEGHSSLHYFLWKPELSNNTGNYQFIGTQLPEPKMNFLLTDKGAGVNGYSIQEGQPYGDMITPKDVGDGKYTFSFQSEKEEDAKSLIVGLYSKCKNKAFEKCAFCQPFTIRYALRLFDGSYTKISTPILMLAAVRKSVGFTIVNNEISARIYPSFLIFNQITDLRDWSDIIKGVSIFISKPVEVHNTDSIGADNRNIDAMTGKMYIDRQWNVSGTDMGTYYRETSSYNCITAFSYYDDTQINNEIVQSMSVYYKIIDLDCKPLVNFVSANKYIRPNDLKNLTTLEQLGIDDYYSHCDLSSSVMCMYNKRLHIANVKRGFYEGNTLFTHSTYTGGNRNIDYYVYIKTADGERVIRNNYTTNDVLGFYFFYPDQRAYKVDFIINGNPVTKITLELKTHPFLNGAYYINDTLPESESYSQDAIIPVITTNIPDINDTFEQLQNEVWVSEVNNPFVFNASGVNTVGNGSIIGIISNTQALSQGQFGQFPLFCFTTDGVWTLQTSSEGTYSSAHPISREICNNKDSITATDNLVFFSSEKGLMMINGSEVSCVSSQLSGKTYIPTPKEVEMYNMANIEPVSFVYFIKKCKIAYDYRDNLLWIVNSDYKHCFLLSIESGAYAMTTLSGYPVNVINDYPDTLIEVDYGQSEYKTLSLINRPNINDDERRISSFIISRPMKIGDQNSLKTPTMIRYIGNNNQKAAIRMRLFASDDLINWVRINSLRGRGFKYYKYNFIFEDLLPTDTFSGVTERWQFKYQSKFR